MRIEIFTAEAGQRAAYERTYGPFASDVVVLVAVDSNVIGWGDDYGTFRPFQVRHNDPAIVKPFEALIEAASDSVAAVLYPVGQ